MIRSGLCFLVLLTGLAMVGATPAAARALSLRIADAGLTPEDFTILTETARQLYDVPNPAPGRILSWSNPASGSHGTVKLAGLRKNCVFLQHMVYAAGQKTPRELRSQRCKSADGRWLLQP